MTERDQCGSHTSEPTEAAAATEATAVTEERATAEATVPTRVLVVGDGPVGSGELASSIEDRSERFMVETVTDAEAGLGAVEEETFDCVVSGYELPESDGIDLLEAIRERHGTLPFVLFTERGSELVASRAVSAGVDEYLPADDIDDPYATLVSRIGRVVSASRAERRFADHPDRMRAAFCRIDAEWRLTHLDDRAAELLDCDAADLLGDRIWDRFRGIAGTAVEERFRTAMETGEPTDFEFHFDRLDVDLDVDVYPSETGLSVCFRDITERRELECGLQELSERLQFAVDGADIGVWDWDLRTDEVRFDEQWAAILGYDLSEIAFDLSEWEDRVHPDDIGRAWSALEAHFAGETESYQCDYRMRSKGGEWKWIRDRGRVVERDENGEPVRAIGIHIDVTEEKERERVLERTSARLEALYEGSPDMIDIHDETGQIVDANRAMTAELGYDREEITEMSVWDIDEGMDPDEACDVWDGLETGETLRLETTFSRKDGTKLPVEVHVRRVDVQGESRFLASSRDISERKAYERRIERENERLDEFASVVSHDLRNPLNVLSGYLELARESGDDAYFDRCESALDEMERLIADVLTLARQGDAVGSVDPVRLGVLAGRYADDEFGSVATETEAASVTDGGDTTATLDVVVDTEGEVLADPGRLKRLLGNLFRNAAEHGGDGVVVGDISDGFYVADDGPGIPADRRDEVFESGRSTSESGTGFGLAIVQRIAEAHGWNVSLTESETGGARFEFTGVDRP